MKNVPLNNITCKIAGKNVLTLELCCYKTENMNDFSEKEMVIERVVEKLKCECYEGNVTLRFMFLSDFCAKDLKLIVEEAKECKIKLNGIDAETDSQESFYSTAFSVIKLPDSVRVGENVIELSRYTKPQVALTPTDDVKHLFELFRSPIGGSGENPSAWRFYGRNAAGMVLLGKRFFITPKRIYNPPPM